MQRLTSIFQIRRQTGGSPMRFQTLCMAAVLAVGAVGIAHATPFNGGLITNGDFSATSPGQTIPTQFGDIAGTPGYIQSKKNGNIVSKSCGNLSGNFITGWTGNSKSYEIWYPNAKAAHGTNPCTSQNSTYAPNFPQRMSKKITAPPLIASPTGSFIGLDGIGPYDPANGVNLTNASISQQVFGLVAGDEYTVSFWWGNTQLQNRTGSTTEQLQVFLDTEYPVKGDTYAYATPIVGIPKQGFSGWTEESFTFTADSTSTWLSFLSVGTPDSLPPFAVLTGVSMFQNIKVPEPSDLAMFGGGLFGLGMLIVFARRREIRRRAADGDSPIV
ncbi:MAG: PEP-CTERM sorting domain-containing protein [Rhodanobacteraceae bacterium]